ncbi:hypothetical protein C5Y97_06670 [Blastopirellula marina]|uniref:Uncharacterized protein n=1 Tax=Blastopirellula marina TaxID=124 RepID=A0A2S8G6E6_9BACT|nr:hypothetical protein C5Y98_06670 [Blastopirellula marina]PTL45372.1 hypothetical protein C5Y97_06670 [Blastopirellula marina]
MASKPHRCQRGDGAVMNKGPRKESEQASASLSTIMAIHSRGLKQIGERRRAEKAAKGCGQRKKKAPGKSRYPRGA